MARLEIVDVTDEARFGLVPPCADPSFDHRTCDYWEDADRGSKARRPSWLPAPRTGSAAGTGSAPGALEIPTGAASTNPFAPAPRAEPNPFLPASKAAPNPFAPAFGEPARNPFLDDRTSIARRQSVRASARGPPHDRRRGPAQAAAPRPWPGHLRQLRQAAASRRRGRRLLPVRAAFRLPTGAAAEGAIPAAAGRAAAGGHHLHRHHGRRPAGAATRCGLSEEVCGDLAGRGFAAVEAYPEVRASGTRNAGRPARVLDPGRFPAGRGRRALPGHAP